MRGYNALIDWLNGTAAKHDRLLSIIAITLFVLSSASYAGFIRLPHLSLLTGWPAIAFGAAVNAVWWGFVRPHAQERRERGHASATED